MPSVKNIGKPYAGKPHVRFDEGGQAIACSLLYPLIPALIPDPFNSINLILDFE